MKKINILFFILLPFVDVITALSTRLIDLPVSLGIIIKGLYILVLSIYVVFYSKSKYKKMYLWYIGSIILFTLLYFVTKLDLLNSTYLFTEVTYLFKALYASILFFGLLVIYDDSKFDSRSVNRLMIYSLFVYCLLLIIPTITGTNFNGYEHTENNNGSIGWFYAGNDVSAIMLMLYPFIYTFFNKKIDSNNRKTYLYYLLLVLVVASVFVLGTKTGWLGLILITLVLFLIELRSREKSINFIPMLVLTILLIPLTFITPAVSNTNNSIEEIRQNDKDNKISIKNDDKVIAMVTDKKEEVVTSNNTYTRKQVPDTCKTRKVSEFIHNKTLYRIINVTLSGRQNKAYTGFLMYNKAPIFDKFFGIGYSNTERINDCNVAKYIEMDIIDIFIHYGIIGLIIVFFPFGYVVKVLIDNKKNIGKDTIKYISIGIIMLLISLAAGHVIGYPSSGIYLTIYLLLLLISVKEKDKLID